MSRRLFEEIVTRTGLAPMIGPGTVQRALHAVGVSSPEHAQTHDYLRALPELRARMAIYLEPAAVEQRLRQIEAHLKHGSSG
ncbi:hypothetical protein LVJ94_18535 [Pendulispora rubella]|uniref:Uncharacterized protein n=1 Tax=Pendulispora rubella TaxID=2741070 RepID=A0ABZ2LFQ8_9BACT